MDARCHARCGARCGAPPAPSGPRKIWHKRWFSIARVPGKGSICLQWRKAQDTAKPKGQLLLLAGTLVQVSGTLLPRNA